MGMRLHYAQHYAPQWEGGYFNWDADKWDALFRAKFRDNGWSNEDETEYEVDRQDILAYIEELHDEKPEAKNEFFHDDEGEPNSGYTNEQIVQILEEILTSEDDTIRLEFF